MKLTVFVVSLSVLISAGLAFYKFAIPAIERWMEWRTKLRNVKTISKRKGFREINYVLHPLESPDEEFPLTIEEAKEFVGNSRLLARVGLGEIHFMQRPSGYSYSIYGSFTPNGGEKSDQGSKICLYSLKKDKKGYRMYTDGDLYFYASKREAGEYLLFTLGHELAHNLFYNKDRNMFDGNIEQLCDHFAVEFGTVNNFGKLKRSRMIYHDGIERGSYESLKRQGSASAAE